MEFQPGQRPDEEEFEQAVADRVVQALQGGPVGHIMQQTFKGVHAAGNRLVAMGEQMTDLEGRVADASALAETAVAQIADATTGGLEQLGEQIKEGEQALDTRIAAGREAIEERGSFYVGRVQDIGEVVRRDGAQIVDDARAEADRAADVAQTATGLIAESRLVADALRTGALEQVVAAIREIRTNPDAYPRQLAVVKKLEGLAAPTHHHQPLINAAMQVGVPVWLHGEAGSGKSTAGEIAAERHELPFRSLGLNPLTSDSKFTGFIDAGGVYHATGFREIYEEGGIFLFDEIDNGHPGVLTLLNGGIANGHFEFPDARVPKHATTRFIAAANTIGKGATAEYVGRNRIDAATLDRFAFVPWDIDEDLEEALMTGEPKMGASVDISEGGIPTPKQWLSEVRRYRHAAEASKAQVLVSTRASLYGKQLAEAGVGMKWLKEMLIFKGMTDAMRRKIETR